MDGRPGKSLGTRVGRRTLTLFVLCAVVPVTALAVAAYGEVRRTLIAEAERRLERTAKQTAVDIGERSSWLIEFLRANGAAAARGDENGLARRFRRVWFEGAEPGTAGKPEMPLTDRQRVHLGDGFGVIVRAEADPTQVYYGVSVSRDGQQVVVWGEPEPRFLWGFSEEEAISPSICVLGQERQVIACSADYPSIESADARVGADEDVRNAGRALLASRTVFLGHEFAAADWTVLALQPPEVALAPVSSFGRTFAAIVGLALLVVFAVSHIQIRRTTAPLEALHAATRRVSAGDFTTRVVVASRDEFGDLADGFTAMSGEIGRQFTLLRGLDDVDRAALEGRNAQELWSVALSQIETLVSCTRQIIAIPSAEAPNAPWFGEYWITASPNRRRRLVAIAPKAVTGLALAPTSTVHPVSVDAVADIGGDEALRWQWVALPLWHAGLLQGVLLIGRDPPWRAEEQPVEVRRVADRLAIAFSNLHLVRRLDALNLGAMTAFARAIDANSPWTAGHSERVTEVALTLGNALGLGAPDLDTLRRGSLLHDIGKIGVPPEVLNKSGPLDPAERAVVESHPVLGARILEPVGAFGDILPLVRHHHERLDGRGYPDRLVGSQIDTLTRVLSIADVYDALVSARPYRAGMEPSAAVALMLDSADTQFDRHLLNLFVALHEQGTLVPIYRADAPSASDAAALSQAVGAGRHLTPDFV
jgi:putative nucleotidyltransferase with HDIG domain